MNSEIYKKYIDIEKLLEKSEALNDSQKEFFRALAEAVNINHNDLFEHIQNSTFDMFNAGQKYIQVYTLLDTEDDYSNDVFYPMLESDEDEGNIVFLDCSYKELNTFDISAEGKKIKLEKTDIFVKKEKILSSLFRMYNIEAPYIYSPYSRRAFAVYEYDEKASVYKPLNFKRDNIKLEIENLIYGKLLWNVSITNSTKLQPKIVTINNTQFYRYKEWNDKCFITPVFKNSYGDYILPENDYLFPEFTRLSGDTIDFLKDSIDKNGLSDKLMKVEIKENKIVRNRQHCNILDNNKMAPKRILTKADLLLAIEKYYQIPEEFKGTSFVTNSDTIKDYLGCDRYSYCDLSEVSRNNKNLIYLKFSDSGVDNFFTDRVNCFISFMRYNYPNFYWVGIRE